jgi:hypothetical protein
MVINNHHHSVQRSKHRITTVVFQTHLTRRRGVVPSPEKCCPPVFVHASYFPTPKLVFYRAPFSVNAAVFFVPNANLIDDRADGF